MSSNSLQAALRSIQQNDYATLAILTIIGYDYFIVLPKEIKYIWTKSWTSVSTLFVLVRYVGLVSLLGPTLMGSSFMYATKNISGWTSVLFFGAADLVMIFRVWAMYRQSRAILATLLALFALEMACVVIVVGIGNYPRVSITTIQILNVSVCVVGTVAPVWTKVSTVSRIILGAVICTLAVVEFMRQALQIYRTTSRWQPNRYLNLLFQQGILYFFFIFLFNLISVLSASGDLPTQGWQVIPLFIVEIIPVYTLTPRFIMSVREVYARDSQGVPIGGIDTGFGLSSVSSRGVGAEMVFANTEQAEDEVAEEIPMEVGVARFED